MKYKILTGILLIVSCYAQAQFDEPMKAFPTPEAASFAIYGKVPVNGFTGAPDITIPLHDFKVKEISLPLDLSYHIASVKPNMHPSWVGLGWNLLAGGCITRKVNCLPDELMGEKDREAGYLAHYGDLDTKDWASNENMNKYQSSIAPSDQFHEAVPDEYNFYFCGYSGSFYLDHTGEWQVCCDKDIKVLFDKSTDCINISDIRKNLSAAVHDTYHAQWYNKRLINSFTLVTPDGVRYEFGGKEATEYSIPYFSQTSSYLVASTWFLTRIISPTGYEVSLTYEPGDPIVEIKPFYTYLEDQDGHWSGCLTKGSEACRECMLMFPVYLKKMRIGESDRTIEFESSIRRDLKIGNLVDPKALLNLEKQTQITILDCNIFYHIDLFVDRSVFVKGYDDLKWRKLDRIRIRDGAVRQVIDFAYTYNDLSNSRIELNELKVSGQGSYRFSYYRHTKWPDYYTDQDDHWVFFNGKRELVKVDRYEYGFKKEPAFDEKVRTSEVLSQITYPTGGKVKFIYERNECSKYIDEMNKLHVTSTESTGGLRIKRIVRIQPDNRSDGSLSYFYVDNFKTLSDTAYSSLRPSSGILAKYPTYQTSFDVTLNNETHKYTMFSSGAMAPFQINAYGSHIGYTNVIEVARDGNGAVMGYKKTTYSNFEDGDWGDTHLDELPLNGAKYNDYLLNRLSDKSMERGKILSEMHYSPTGTLKKKVVCRYSPTPDKVPVRGLSFNQFCLGQFAEDIKMLYVMDAFNYYTYSYNLIGKQEYVYGSNIFDYVKTSADYTYNQFNLLVRESLSAGNGNKIVTTYQYPCDLPGNSASEMLNEQHIQVPLVKRTELEKPEGNYVFLSKELFNYRSDFGVYLYSYQKAVKNESRLVEYYKCNETDGRGNPMHVVLKDGLECGYFWSAYSCPLMEIRNISYEDFKKIGAHWKDHEWIRSTFPNAEVTAFDFTEDGKRTREVNARSLETLFKFDSSGWLRRVYDDDLNLLKQYDYEYRIK